MTSLTPIAGNARELEEAVMRRLSVHSECQDRGNTKRELLKVDGRPSPAWVNKKQANFNPKVAKSGAKKWLKFFADPLDWWDHRSDKENLKFPDFKHKRTKEALWVDADSTPHWVRTKLADLLPGTVQKSVFSWNKLITKVITNGEHEMAMEIFEIMLDAGVPPNKFTLLTVLKACNALAVAENGWKVHAKVIKHGCGSDVFVLNGLIDMYVKCGDMMSAYRTFNNMYARDIVSWNIMISGFSKRGLHVEALKLFREMEKESVDPDSFTFVSVLNACASLRALEDGIGIHALIVERGLESEIFVGTCLVDMYNKCGRIYDACEVFHKLSTKNAVSWNAMISGFVDCGQHLKALELYQRMLKERVKLDTVTFISVVSACASSVALEDGRQAHAHAIIVSCASDKVVASCLVDMYAKCGSIEDAYIVFNHIQSQDVVSWSAMIGGLVHCGHEQKALEAFQQMQREGVQPDTVIFINVLDACSRLMSLEQGKLCHRQVIECGLNSDVIVNNCLINMYVKCGSIQNARKVFDNMLEHDLVSWNTLLGGYAFHGLCREAFDLVEKMFERNVEMDKVSLVCVLSACSHAGYIDEGCMHFESISPFFGIGRTIEHYGCMIDLLGRYGCIDEAACMVKEMNLPPTTSIYMALLGACRVHGHVDMGERIAKEVLSQDSEDSSAYVLLSNIYSAASTWDKKERPQRF